MRGIIIPGRALHPHGITAGAEDLSPRRQRANLIELQAEEVCKDILARGTVASPVDTNPNDVAMKIALVMRPDCAVEEAVGIRPSGEMSAPSWHENCMLVWHD